MLLATRFSIFKPFQELLQVNSTRQGGFSAAPYQSLNLGLNTADNPELVRKNRTHFFNHFSISEQQLAFPEQVHSDRVVWLDKPGLVSRCDGLITQTPNLFLTIQTADCFPVFLYDPAQKVLGIVHSGWRGTSKNIVGKAVQLMKERGGCQSENILAGIGPGVQQSCYQVDENTANFFKAEQLIADGADHFKLDVQGAIVAQLLQIGVLQKNIELDRNCTHCESDRYYSYRRDGGQSGRMMGIIGLRS